MWLEVPTVMGEYLLAPIVLLLVLVLVVMKVSLQPRLWSRRLVVGILLILTGRYVLWRVLSTLNLAAPLNGVFSLGLFSLELLMLISGTIQLFLILNVKERRREADQKASIVIDGTFTFSVDIFIPAYNEQTFFCRAPDGVTERLKSGLNKVYGSQASLIIESLIAIGTHPLTNPINI